MQKSAEGRWSELTSGLASSETRQRGFPAELREDSVHPEAVLILGRERRENEECSLLAQETRGTSGNSEADGAAARGCNCSAHRD